MQQLVNEHHLRSAKRQLAAQKLVEHDAQAVDIATAVDVMHLSSGLLGTHVRGSAHDLAVDRHDRIGLGAKARPKSTTIG